ncbi:50S ribosomal protein L20 [bacterium]|nr:50S ribosomal protein L20 [candidate division CSSED10-310 bacterium]
MARVKRGVKGARKRRRIMKQTKGFQGSRSTLLRTAKETLENSWVYAYRDRRNRKREFRRLWIVRINAAARANGMSYSTLMNGLQRSGVDLDRRMLAHLAVTEPAVFSQLVEVARDAAA